MTRPEFDPMSMTATGWRETAAMGGMRRIIINARGVGGPTSPDSRGGARWRIVWSVVRPQADRPPRFDCTRGTDVKTISTRARSAFTVFAITAAGAAILLSAAPGAQSARPASGAQTSGQMPNFTGGVSSLDAADVRGVRFKYEPAARSYWHTHDGPLVLLIEQGRGRYQIKGQPIREFGPNEPIVLPANVPHWHGAAAKEGMTWVALSVGRKVTWGEPVTDAEYLGR
jgi:quercetin dioxygenase-like cupin family protein